MTPNPLFFPIMLWLHFLCGIMWIGLLYYFNFVNAAAVKEATAAGEAGPIGMMYLPIGPASPAAVASFTAAAFTKLK